MLNKETNKNFFREMLTPYILKSRDQVREEVESSEKDKPCLIKITTLLSACQSSHKRELD